MERRSGRDGTEDEGEREKGAEGEQSADVHRLFGVTGLSERRVFQWPCLYQKPRSRGEIQLVFPAPLYVPYRSCSRKRQRMTAGAKPEWLLP